MVLFLLPFPLWLRESCYFLNGAAKPAIRGQAALYKIRNRLY